MQAAFEQWLTEQGWQVARGRRRDYVDVDATPPEDGRLLGGVKGDTTSPGLDVDTAYGQLLRRMTGPDVRYALVVPEGAIRAAERVPVGIRRLLGIELYAVDPDGSVRSANSMP